MRIISNQLARLYETDESHKFHHPRGVTKENIKFQLIIDQTGTYTYNAAQVVSSYLKPLCKNK